MIKRMALFSLAGLALSAAEQSAGRLMRAPDGHNNGGEDRDEAETRQGAAAAGGYDAPRRSASSETSAPASIGTQPDIGAARTDDSFEGGIDAKDRDRLTSQEAREAAGPFTGTGNQDAMRTAGRQGGTDANHADQRTVEADSKDNTNKDADKATKEAAKEQRQERDS